MKKIINIVIIMILVGSIITSIFLAKYFKEISLFLEYWFFFVATIAGGLLVFRIKTIKVLFIMLILTSSLGYSQNFNKNTKNEPKTYIERDYNWEMLMEKAKTPARNYDYYRYLNKSCELIKMKKVYKHRNMTKKEYRKYIIKVIEAEQKYTSEKIWCYQTKPYLTDKEEYILSKLRYQEDSLNSLWLDLSTRIDDIYKYQIELRKSEERLRKEREKFYYWNNYQLDYWYTNPYLKRRTYEFHKVNSRSFEIQIK